MQGMKLKEINQEEFNEYYLTHTASETKARYHVSSTTI
jgi:hypothetical protein